MADIFHNFPINSSARKVFEAISTAQGLDSWWTNNSAVTTGQDGEYRLEFGSEYTWLAKVSRCETVPYEKRLDV